MYICIMTNLWPQKSSWHLQRRYGKLFFYDSQHQMEQFKTNLVKIGACWIFFYPCIYEGFEKFNDPWTILAFISQTKHLKDLVLLTFFCVPSNDLRNNLLCYLTLFMHSDILMPIEVVILENALYKKKLIRI